MELQTSSFDDEAKDFTSKLYHLKSSLIYCPDLIITLFLHIPFEKKEEQLLPF